MYRSMLDTVGHDGTILYETIEDPGKMNSNTKKN
jgi:hypothetical protein